MIAIPTTIHQCSNEINVSNFRQLYSFAQCTNKLMRVSSTFNCMIWLLTEYVKWRISKFLKRRRIEIESRSELKRNVARTEKENYQIFKLRKIFQQEKTGMIQSKLFYSLFYDSLLILNSSGFLQILPISIRRYLDFITFYKWRSSH